MKITVLNKKQVTEYQPNHKAILIRISDTRELPKVKGDYISILELFFSDIDDPESHYSIQKKDIEAIYSFVQKHKNEVEEIVIHCEYAQGRSPAVGYVLSRYFGSSFDLNLYPDINKLVIKKLIDKFFPREQESPKKKKAEGETNLKKFLLIISVIATIWYVIFWYIISVLKILTK